MSSRILTTCDPCHVRQTTTMIDISVGELVYNYYPDSFIYYSVGGVIDEGTEIVV